MYIRMITERRTMEDNMIKTVKIAFFSPTGTTQKVVEAIATGMKPDWIETMDLTKPTARRQPLETSKDEFLIIGVPVYMGRVPSLLNEWFNSIQMHNTPTACVVVYGNRVYDNALLELKDIIKKRGGFPIAGAAYIGEHSFSNSETPSLGRPNKKDILHAQAFGENIHDKLQSSEKVSEVEVPGTYPYGGVTELWDVDFITVSDACKQCGVCAELCPQEAISKDNSSLIDQHKCITCCACLKGCPQKARNMKPGPVKDAQKRVNTLFVTPKNPEFFL